MRTRIALLLVSLLVATCAPSYGVGVTLTAHVSTSSDGCTFGGTCSEIGQVNVVGQLGSGAVDGTYQVQLNSAINGQVNIVVSGGGTAITCGGAGCQTTGSGNTISAFSMACSGFTGSTTTWPVTLNSHPAGSTSSFSDSSVIWTRVSVADNISSCGPNKIATVTLIVGTAASGSAIFSGQLHVGKNAKAHTFALKYNGTTVATHDTPVNNSSPFTSQINFTNSTAHNGDSWAWIVDGVTQQSGTVTLINIGTVESPIWQYTVTYDTSISGGDAPTPTPAATPTPTAFPTATPQTGSTPNIITYNRGGSAGNSTAVTVVNPADIYNPIVADIDKTNLLLSQPQPTPDNSAVVNKLDEMEHSGTAAPGTATDTHESSDFTNRGHIDDLQSTVDAGKTARDGVISNLTASANAFIADASALSGASFGNTTVIPMPFSYIGHAPAVGQINLPDSIDLSDWSGLIAMLRAVLLWLLRIAFWVLVYKLFSAHGIQAT